MLLKFFGCRYAGESLELFKKNFPFAWELHQIWTNIWASLNVTQVERSENSVIIVYRVTNHLNLLERATDDSPDFFPVDLFAFKTWISSTLLRVLKTAPCSHSTKLLNSAKLKELPVSDLRVFSPRMMAVFMSESSSERLWGHDAVFSLSWGETLGRIT